MPAPVDIAGYKRIAPARDPGITFGQPLGGCDPPRIIDIAG
jgi:hypothetical protein